MLFKKSCNCFYYLHVANTSTGLDHKDSSSNYCNQNVVCYRCNCSS